MDEQVETSSLEEARTGREGQKEKGTEEKEGGARQDARQDEDGERVQAAPNMVASHTPRPRQTRKKKSGSARKNSTAKATEEKPRWADCVEEELDKQEELEEEREEAQVEDGCKEREAEEQLRGGGRAEGKNGNKCEAAEESEGKESREEERERETRGTESARSARRREAQKNR